MSGYLSFKRAANWALLGILLLWGSASVLSPQARAEMIEIRPASAAIGPQMSWGQCPCFRWVIQVEAAGGAIETQEFLISSEALFQFRDAENTNFLRYESRLFKMGAIQALWKGGHMGVAFDGVTVGKDRDKGYSDIVRTGFRFLVNALLTQSARLDIRSGFEFESMRVNYGDQISRGTVDTQAVFNISSGRWSALATAHIGIDDGKFLTPAHPRLGAEIAGRWRFLHVKDIEAGLTLAFSADHDPFRELLGMNPNLISGSLLMDLSYVGGDHVLR